MSVGSSAPSRDVERVWSEVLEVVKTELNTPTFKTWFEHTAPVDIVDDRLVIAVQNDFARDWLESRYSELLKAALLTVTGLPLSLEFTIMAGDTASSAGTEEDRHTAEEVFSAEMAVSLEQPKREEMGGVSPTFNPKHTFDSFVIGTSNRFSHAAALAVAEAPGRAYNPLFIYGGVGLGKTHLLQAIGHYVQQSFPHMKITYVSTEQFTNDFINSIGDKKRIEGFRRQYRTNDVLLVDDIQFLRGKEGTQEEFFHTFNALQQAGKQVVLSSDRPPKDIAALEERLRSRFEMGLITDIQPPDLETRIAILKRKVEVEELDVSYDVLAFVADRISSNIRELEGALIRVVAFSSLTRSSVDIDLAKSVLQDIFPERSSQPISVATIQREVSKYYTISHSELIGSKRSQSVVYPRQVAMYLAREMTDLSLPRIGAEFGGRDHTTVMHAYAKIVKLMNADRDVYNQIQTLTNQIRQKS